MPLPTNNYNEGEEGYNGFDKEFGGIKFV